MSSAMNRVWAVGLAGEGWGVAGTELGSSTGLAISEPRTGPRGVWRGVVGARELSMRFVGYPGIQLQGHCAPSAQACGADEGQSQRQSDAAGVLHKGPWPLEGSGYQNDWWADMIGHKRIGGKAKGQCEKAKTGNSARLTRAHVGSTTTARRFTRAHARGRCGARGRLAPSPSQKTQPPSADAAGPRSAVLMSTARMRRTPRPSPTRQGQRAEA